MMTRRQFSDTLAGAVGLTGTRLLAETPLHIGIGTFSYHTLSIDAMIRRLVELRIRDIEMSRTEFMLMKPPSLEMCRSAREKFDRASINCVSYYTATIKDDQDLDYAVRNAKTLGARNVSGDATGTMLAKIDDRFTREGLTFGIHNHWFKQKFEFESAEDVLRGLKGRSKTFGASLDVGQMASCGHDPVDAVHKLASYLKMVHLKDVAAVGAENNVLLGTGICKIPEVMKALKQINYRGLVAIEYEYDGDSSADMRTQVAYARKLA